MNQLGELHSDLSYIQYIQGSINKIPKSLQIRPNDQIKQLEFFKIESFTSTLNQSNPINAKNLYQFRTNELQDFSYTSIYNKRYYVDNYSGKVENSDSDAYPLNAFPYFTPTNFSILPTSLINYYSTGYLKVCQNETNNYLFLQLLNSNVINISELLKLFSIDITNLVRHFINLLLYSETINIQKIMSNSPPVDYRLDLLDQNYQIQSSRLLYFSSLQKIIEYIESESLIDVFLKEWFWILKNQFDDGFSHSSQPDNPNAIMRSCNKSSFKSPFHILRKDIDGWLIMTTCFDSNERAKIIINGVDLTANKMVSILDKELQFDFEPNNLTFVAIPFKYDDNSLLSGTLFDLVISYKYFINFCTKYYKQISNINYYRQQIYILYFRSVYSKSTYFYNYMKEVLQHITGNLPIITSDLNQDFVREINLLAAKYSSNDFIFSFLKDVEIIWDERVLLPLKTFFPEFITKSEREDIKSIKDPEFGLPSNKIPDIVTKSFDISLLIGIILRVIPPKESIIGFPFHILLKDWGYYTSLYPPFSIKNVDPDLIQVTFLYFVPDYIKIIMSQNGIILDYSYTDSMSNSITIDDGFFKAKQVLYLKKKSGSNWPQFIFKSKDLPEQDAFILSNRDRFVSDMTLFTTMWKSDYDQSILSCFSNISSLLKGKDFDFNQNDPTILMKSKLSYSYNIISIRAKYVLLLNWIVLNNEQKLELDERFKTLIPSISSVIKIEKFRNQVHSKSTSSRPELTVNRTAAVDIRIGISTDLKNTLIYQMSKKYNDRYPGDYRNNSDQPWHVSMVGEHGIDVGGPARELVTELAIDLCCPACGLVIPTPNNRNEVGELRDCVIPINNPNHRDVAKQYKYAGVHIGICIRTGLVQEFNFPPLVWYYLIHGTITIEHIFEIDQNYMLLIQSLQEAIKSNMPNSEFVNRFNLKFVVLDSSGVERPLTQRGKSETVTISNCSQYISLANSYRLNEMKENLENMRIGLWENLAIKPDFSLDWQTLEFAACGLKEISLEDLKSVTVFSGIPDGQQRIFWQVIEAFTPKERSDLLKFSTGRVRLPPKIDSSNIFLKLDKLSGTDRLPTSSTCFHTLHYPTYSSFEKAYRMLKIASEYTGSFENS